MKKLPRARQRIKTPPHGKRRVDSRPPIFAKLTRPIPHKVYERKRLFSLLDKARARPIVWVAAQGGAGKTTLISSYIAAKQLPALWFQVDQNDADPASFFYWMGVGAKALSSKKKVALPLLTPEYYAALSVFTTNYFRNLFERMKTPGVLVLDDYHDIGDPNSPIHEILSRGFEQIPDGINVVVVSREEVPQAYARHRANGHLSLLGWDEIKLTEGESVGIAKLRDRRKRLSRTTLKELHQETRGWVAGLVLLTEHAHSQFSSHPLTDRSATQSVFDYFASEVFRRSEKDIQDFLLKTAFLPKMNVMLVRTLTGHSNSEAILQGLARRNYFTVSHQDGIYEYHPLFRAFLQSRAAEAYPDDELRHLKKSSAELLAQEGDVQTAVLLFEQTQDWSALLALILSQAPQLAAQGRTLTIETWLDSLPISITDNPWALYWKGVCQMASSPPQARAHFERAFALFEKQEDASPLYLAWSGIIESFILEYNDLTPMLPWLDRYETLANARLAPPAHIEAIGIFAYISGLTHTRYGHPDLLKYVERAERLLHQEPDINRRFARAITLIFYYLWGGYGVKAKRLLEILSSHVMSPDMTPLARLCWHLYKVIYTGATGAVDESIQATNEALALAEETGIRVLDFQFLGWNIWSQARVGNVAAANTSLQRMGVYAGRGRMMDAFRHICACTVYMHEGDFSRAVDEGSLALQLGKDTSSLLEQSAPHFALAHAYARQGLIDTALEHSRQARTLVERMQSKIGKFFCAFSEANAFRLQGKNDLALTSLREMLTLAREMNAVTPPWCPRDDAVALYAKALEADIETDYVRRIIRKTHLLPPAGFASEHWPWRIRIYTLGRFAVFVDDARLNLTERAQKKPLELLRAIVILGGRSVETQRLIGMLWPNIDRRSAEHALDTLLYRLRKLLGEECIERHKGQHTLNPRYCWLDIWALEGKFDSLDIEMPSAISARYLFDLYRGPFLDGNDTAPVVLRRERLRSKFLRTLEHLSDESVARGDYPAAIEYYQKAIETDPIAETSYFKLMQCYRRMNRLADALAVYRRCQEIFTSILGVEPSTKTKALYEDIRTEGTKLNTPGQTGA